MIRIGFGWGIAFAIIGALVAVLIYAVIGVIKNEIIFTKKYRKGLILLMAVLGLVGAYIGAVPFSGVRIVKDEDMTQTCSVKKCNEPAIYRIIAPWFGEIYSDPFYCAEHLADAKERVNAKRVLPAKEKDPWGNKETDAFVAAQLAVEQRLKSPSSSKFCSLREATIVYYNELWLVSGWVEAQNSFGATLRNSFSAKIHFTGKGSYEIVSCSIY